MCLQLYSMEIIRSLLTLIITTHYHYLVSCHLIYRTMVKSIPSTYECILKILALHKYSDPQLKCQGLKKQLYHIIKGEKRNTDAVGGLKSSNLGVTGRQTLIRVGTKQDRNKRIIRNSKQRSLTLKHVRVVSIKLTGCGICLGQIETLSA